MSRQVRHLYEFGPFRLDPEKPCLWRDGEPVSLTPKAVETLLVLVQQNGKLVEREDLMKAIWPDTFVEDGNLNFNVSMLRKALGTDEAGEQYIQTVPRHGYRFRAEVRRITEDVPALVVEKHTRAQVVIEERDVPTPRQLAAAPQKRRWYYLGAAGLILLVAGLIWFVFNRPNSSGSTSANKNLSSNRHTQIREAFDAYWRGRFFLDKRSPDKAISEFQRAIDLDPKYALAYSGLADAYTTKAGITSGHDPELYEKARALTTTALALDPNLADAHNSLAQVKYYYDWDWPAAEESFKKALELEPNNVNAHQFYGRLLATMSRYDEAIAEIQKARELDPRSADLLVPLFAVLEKRGEFDEALRVLETSLNMEGDLQIARRAVGKIHLLKGDYVKVIELANELFPHPNGPDLFWASMLATAYHKTGREDLAAALRSDLVELSITDSKALYFLAMHYSELNRRDEAIAALEKCLELREDRMVWTKDEPRFAGIKGDPRFNQILKKLKLS